MTSTPDRLEVPSPDEDALEVVNLGDCRGLGIRARRGFAPGDILDRFAGVVGDEVCQHSLQVGVGLHVSGTRYIGFLSHGCDANAALDMAEFRLVARRSIEPGEIVAIDYAETEERLYRQFACVCAAAHCRGWITGRNEPPNDEGLAWLAEYRSTPRDDR